MRGIDGDAPRHDPKEQMMSIGGYIRRILGPRGVERARAAGTRPRHLIQRVIDTPGGAEYVPRVAGLETAVAATRAEIDRVERAEIQRFEQHQVVLADLATALSELNARLDQIEDMVGAQYGQALVAHQAVLVKAEKAEGDARRLWAKHEQVVSDLAQAGGRFEESLRRLDDVRTVLETIEAELHIPPYQAEPNLLTVMAKGGSTTFGFDETTKLGTDYRSFEDVFRGPEDMIKERQRPYLDWAQPGDRVVDLGCGRGELLELFREAGIDAVGVDCDTSMIERCLTKNLPVVHAEALKWIEGQPDGSLDLVISAQFLEHLPPDRLDDLFAGSRRVLRRGGRFIAETVNPHCFSALRTFWVDPAHHQPLFPEALLLLLHAAGFSTAHVEYPCYTGPGDPRLGAGEYAVIATSN
jgi:SAM-dependent methyltransferase